MQELKPVGARNEWATRLEARQRVGITQLRNTVGRLRLEARGNRRLADLIDALQQAEEKFDHVQQELQQIAETSQA